MSQRIGDFQGILEKEGVLVFERVKKFFIEAKNLAPFASKSGCALPPANELAVIVQFLAYRHNLIIGHSHFTPLTSREKEILHTCTFMKKSAESPFYASYIMQQDFVDQLKPPSQDFWIHEPSRSVNVDQKIVDLLVVGKEKPLVEEKWQQLSEEYKTKRKDMLSRVDELRDVFRHLKKKRLASGGILRGSVGSNKRYPTENDVDIVILTPHHNTHSATESLLLAEVHGFKRLNIGDDKTFTIDSCKEYDLDVDLISRNWLPLHPIMARAHHDIIDDSTVLFGEKAIQLYKSKLKEIAALPS